ncbi:MAG: N-6 DNA Methylase [Pelotomaculum sp. PtaU1.Bin065]|nr:MAG: N-6 DNA Methylase [Pelotomaculum sp. PtaU1.Bin065]
MPKKKLLKLIEGLMHKYSTWQVFSDFIEMSAIAISNSVDWIHRQEREARYLEIINRYEKKEQVLFPDMFNCMVDAMEDSITLDGGPTDILGRIFHELELHNKWKGQFFTPISVCEAMGMMMAGDEQQQIKENGFVTVCEPCVGSGAMILGLAKAMKSNDMNYCSQMVVTAQDIDIKCVHMAYIQLSLYGIPGVVVHGNTLTLEEWSRWYTPIYMLDGWLWKQRMEGYHEQERDSPQTHYQNTTD